MGCTAPVPAYRSHIGGDILFREPLDRETKAYDFLRLPCGNCIGCRQARAREWAFRCSLELRDHDRACWVTLTYDDDHVPYQLVKAHLSDYLKRLRSRVHPRRVRFFGSGEYGEQNGRPHYHAILYGCSVDDRHTTEAWTFGFSRVDPISQAAINYVAGYTAKKAGRVAKGERIEVVDDYGEVHSVPAQAPFVLMSRNPGIGARAREYWRSWRMFAVHNGTKMPVPRYLHEAWLNNTTPEEHERLKAEKAAIDRPVLDAYNLDSARLHAEARQNLKRLSRSL